MPIMNGFEFLEEYQRLDFKNKQSVALFLLTTSSNRKDLEKLEAYKVNGVLNKPLTIEMLERLAYSIYTD